MAGAEAGKTLPGQSIGTQPGAGSMPPVQEEEEGEEGETGEAGEGQVETQKISYEQQTQTAPVYYFTRQSERPISPSRR